MKFMEAFERMKQGQKVRRLGGLYLGDLNKQLRLFDESGNKPLHLCDIEAIDWEVVEEKKTLWDRQTKVTDSNLLDATVIEVCYIKEALKEFLNSLPEDGFQYRQFKAKEIFGEELLK